MLTIATAAALVGCGSQPDAASSGIEADDSAGVSVMRVDLTSSSLPELTVVDLQVLAGSEESPIATLRDVVWADSATVAYADNDLKVRFQSLNAATAAAMGGGLGEGPQEFGDLAWLQATSPNALAAFDPTRNALVLLDPHASVVDRVVYPVDGSVGLIDFRGLVGDDLVGVGIPPRRGRPDLGQDPGWGYSNVYRVSPDGAVELLFEAPLTKCREVPQERCAPDPSALSGGLAVLEDGIALTPLDQPVVALFSPEGGLKSILRGTKEGIGFQRLFGDRSGRIWFGHANSDIWHRYSPGEAKVEVVRVPESFHPMDAWDDKVVGFSVDSLGVQRVTVAVVAPALPDR